ncbi:hypothetical protein [Rhodopirellula sp. SWK7]|uniref:hypothetical protein n=1 Tax=Rhodopirellula sp. SWK7 TaxID=595460 RepID=UPI0002C01151|nr:hypothetical protein [Rhodopirellula sp. SWK7]EMI46611.1 hypothetical protein RRSWK_00941 [Rhodopirellula sp. SWK7]
MAREEANREDLLAEGVNLPERGRVTDPEDDREFVLGWRNQTALSVFDGADPVFQFNTNGQLRRVYLDGHKLAADAGRLSQLTRMAMPNGQIKLQPHPLTDEQQRQVCDRLAESKAALSQTLDNSLGRIETIGLDADEFLSRVRRWYKDSTSVTIADSPHVDG